MTTVTPRAEILVKAAMKKKIVAFVAAAKVPPTTMKIAYIFGLSKTGAGTYLRELESAGEIHRQPRAMGAPPPSRALPILWMPGQSADFAPKEERVDLAMVMRQRSVRIFPAHFVRDELVAALFGAAVRL